MEVSKQNWYELCELAAKEQDAHRLLELVQEINRLLEKKEKPAPPDGRTDGKTGHAA
jgi:hypothetical protein